MKQELKDFFVNLEERKLQKHKGTILLNQENIVPSDTKEPSAVQYYFDSIPTWVKTERPHNVVFGLATKDLYINSGLITPITCPTNTKELIDNECFKIASQDVNSISDIGYDVKLAGKTPEILKLSKKHLRDAKHSIWSPIKKAEYKDELLEFMTEECFEEFMTMFLLGELCTDSDKHDGNYFLYKTKGAEKYEGIIPIDLEFSEILRQGNHQYKNTKAAFDNFKNRHYCAFTPMSTNSDNYQLLCERLFAIRKLIEDGKLTNNQVSAIKRALEFDLPKRCNYYCDKHGIDTPKQFVYEMMSRLWKENRSILWPSVENAQM